MKPQEILSSVVDLAWSKIKTKTIEGLRLRREGNFQLHLGITLHDVANQTGITEFNIEAEHLLDPNAARNYIDLVCSYGDARTALELKFCTSDQGADNLRRVDFWKDLGTLEAAQALGFTDARFLLITDDYRYLQRKTTSDYALYSMHEGRVIEPGTYTCTKWAGRRGQTVTLQRRYPINWATVKGLHFLQLRGEE